MKESVHSLTARPEEGWIFALDERLLYPQPGGFGKTRKESPDSISD